jgi:hypothetical protein
MIAKEAGSNIRTIVLWAVLCEGVTGVSCARILQSDGLQYLCFIATELCCCCVGTVLVKQYSSCNIRAAAHQLCQEKHRGMRQKRQKLTSASWLRPVWDGFHNLILLKCAPFFTSCRRHRVFTVTCLDACRCAAYLRHEQVLLPVSTASPSVVILRVGSRFMLGRRHIPNLFSAPGCPHWHFSWFYSVPSEEMPG